VFGILLEFWKPIALLLIVVALVGFVAYKKDQYDEGKMDLGRAEVQAKWDTDKAERIARTAAMTMLWDAKRQEAEKASDERDKARADRMGLVASARDRIPVAVASRPVPAVAVDVLNAGAGATNAAGTASESTKTVAASAASADSTIGLLVGWGVVVLDILGECRDRVSEWERFYSSLRSAQPKVSQ